MKRQSQLASKETAIRIQAPEAQDVFLAGSFNDWNPSTMRMQRDSDGSWIAIIPLTPGRHEYKFVVDGRWCCNPSGPEFEDECPGHVRNSLGTLNCTIDVSDESGNSPASQER
ncbi:MAG: glycoside hydrolase family 13 [Planctomycetes bacterium]|nr:glycoside hydrolase family 13 [Planctomycetota bacterium]